jgi:ABC-type sulfate transport system substrate-binding protein
MVVISMKQRHAGQALQALTVVAGMQTGASMYRYYIAVDDDIDPSRMLIDAIASPSPTNSVPRSASKSGKSGRPGSSLSKFPC